MPDAKWFGQMSLLRELSLKDGVLIQKPVREIDACRTNEVIYENERISGRKSFPELNGRKTVQCRFNCEAAFFMANIEQMMSHILATFANILRGNEKCTEELSRHLTELKDYLASGKSNAYFFANNNLAPHAAYYMHYISMRQAQSLMLYIIYRYIEKMDDISSCPKEIISYADAIARGVALGHAYTAERRDWDGLPCTETGEFSDYRRLSQKDQYFCQVPAESHQ